MIHRGTKAGWKNLGGKIKDLGNKVLRLFDIYGAMLLINFNSFV